VIVIYCYSRLTFAKLAGAAVLGSLLLVLCSVSAAQINGYSYQRAIVINHSQVANADQINFPVLVSGIFSDLATVANGGNVRSALGYDIIFTSDAAGQTRLPFEKETYSPSTGSINYWVQVPTVSHTADTIIYMFYGNPSVTTDQSNKTGVWNTNYKAVWHLPNGSTLSANDSTSNANNGTVHGSVSAVAGKIDGAASVAGGTNNGISTTNSITADTSAFTYFLWAKPSGGGTAILRGEDSFGNGWSAAVGMGTNIGFSVVNNAPAQINLTSNATVTTGNWYNVAAVWTPGSGMKLYVNGILDNSNTNTSTTLRSSTKGLQLLVGNPTNISFNGVLDEVEISTVARPASWIATEYNNQSSPATFAVPCPAQNAGATVSNCLRPAPTSYNYVRAVSFNHLKVSNTDQQNFPVLISGAYPDLANVANGGNVQSLQGYDIVFTSDAAGQNLLDHEIDTYNSTTGAANFWVRIPTLSHTADATIYMWYGNAGVVVSQENRPGVWSNSYAAVYHFGNGSSVSGNDSTGINSASVNAVSAVAGTIGGGGSFTGSSSISAIPANALSGSFTIEEWASPNTTSGKLGLYGSRLPSDFGFDAKLDSGAVYEDVGTGTSWLVTAAHPSFSFSANAWHHYVHTVAATGYRAYADGTQIGSGTFTGTPLLLNSTHNLLIGETGFSGEGFSGSIDEARVSTVVRSADWIATEYNNQSSPATFAVTCQGQTVGNSVPPCPVRLPANTYSYTRAITISHAGVPNTDQQNFPVLISGTYADLANVANGGKVQNLQGYDIVFTSDAAGQIILDHEIDTYNSATGAVNLWVRVPVLSHTSDTTIYIWFGNSSATFSQENNPGVWSNGYAAVYHMGNGTAISGSDSSGSNPGTVTSVSATAGVIGGGGSFSGSSSITAIPASSLSGSFTIEEWANPSTTSGSLGLYGSRTPADQSFDAKLYSGGIYEDIGNGSSWLATSSNVSFPYSANIWHFFAHTATTNAYQVYADGIPIGSGTFSGTPLFLDANHDLLIGETGHSGEGFSGLIDEARVSKVLRSADWIATEYNNQNSPGTFFTIAGETPAVVYPQISNVSPVIVGPGVSMTITGTSFGGSQQGGAVVLNNSIGTVVSWNNTQIVATVPSGTSAGKLYVRQNGVNSNAVCFTIANPQIISISPTSGVVGTQITITGTGFGATAGTATVNGTNATIQSWGDTQVVATVAPGTTAGGVRVVNAGVTSNAVTFTMPNPQITRISPTVGAIGTQITITGTGFGATSGTASVNGTNATIQSWNDTQVVATVAVGATSGGVQVVNGGVSSNAVTFTILNPQIEAISPTSGAIGTQITITGTGFGSATGTVSVNGTNATVQSWNDTQVLATVASGTTTGGLRVIISGVSSNAITFTVTSAGPQLNTSRYGHSATMLDNGTVLVAGGINCASAGACTYLNSAEIYNPNSGHFTNTGSILAARSAPAILLGNGKVLIAGGYSCDSSGNCASLNTAEIYDPVAGTFSNAGTMTVDRYAHTMTLLNNGKVLIAGGESCASSTSCSALQTAEIYDPVSGASSPTGSLVSARFNAAAVALTSGQVLIAGGFDGTNFPANAELFDPVAGTFAATGALNTPRASATAIVLDNGSVVIAGGSTCSSTNCPTATAELYASGAFSTISNLTVSRVDQTITLLTNGQSLVAGGYTACSSSCVSDSTTELFDPQAGSFTAGQGLSAARSQHTATLLNDGTVLLVGGINNGQSLSSTDVYHPSSLALPQLASITITPANPSIAPGATQPLTAMGFDSGANLLGTLQAVIWSSSAPSIATVTNAAGSAGVVNSLTPGTATITATVGGVTGSTQVTVPAPPSLVSLAITPSNPSITLDLSAPLQLDVKGTYSDGSMQDLTSTVTWNTSNSSIAQILADPNAPGIVYGVAAGTTDITAAYNSINASTPITVLPAPAPPNPTIASISPTSGVPGLTQVVINGSGFGGSQANAYILLGSAPGVISSWSDTQIVAVVANGSTSGTVQVQEGEVSSNSLPFTVNTATISAVSPTSGGAGTPVRITGSGFGDAQGNGVVWLGNAAGVVTNWSDGEVDAVVAQSALSGNAQVLQNGEWSNAVPFTVPGNPLISAISPNSGPAGTTNVTISGSGFGSSPGIVSIGGAPASIGSWNDQLIQATVSGTAVTGVVKIQENNTWSNAKAFTVTGGSNPAVTLVPDVVGMSVGDTRTLQALDSNNQPLTGLTWSSSDTTIASLSTDDPPVITALAAGSVTITAATGSADITVYAGALPLGTTIWSNPGNASGVQQIVPAVPSSTGIADVFALQNDCSVQAIASDGTAGWTKNIGTRASGSGCKNVVPDFQGGLLAVDSGSPIHPGINSTGSIQKFDGMTGQPYPAYTITQPRPPQFVPFVVVPHTDGTIFTIDGDSVIGIDPTTGIPKFQAKMEHSTSVQAGPQCDTASVDQLPTIKSSLIIAGDGYAYVLYTYGIDSQTCAGIHLEVHARLLRVGTGGDSSEIVIGDSAEDIIGPIQSNQIPTYETSQMITNADQGVMIALYAPTPNWCAYNGNPTDPNSPPSSGCVPGGNNYQLITTSGTSISSRVTLPSTIDYFVPILQSQDGSFFGIVDYTGNGNDFLAKFDQSGNLQWSKPNYYALIATSDGGVIAQTDYPYSEGFSGLPFYSGPAITFDANGNQTGQLGTLPTQSWMGDAYEAPLVQTSALPLDYAASFSFSVAGNQSGTGAAIQGPPYPRMKSCFQPNGTSTCPYDYLLVALETVQSKVSGSCPDCATYVFSKMHSAADQSQFSRFISRFPPRFFDGTRSTLKLFETCDPNVGSVSWDSGFGCFAADTGYGSGPSVGDFFTSNPGVTALAVYQSNNAQDPHGKQGLKIFFRPSAVCTSAIAFDSACQIGNESVLFHESLHEYYGYTDKTIQQLFGITVRQDCTANISDYISFTIFSHNTNSCGN
jgi:hypothetical protein